MDRGFYSEKTSQIITMMIMRSMLKAIEKNGKNNNINDNSYQCF